MCPLNPALDRVFRIGGSLPSLGDGSTEKIPLLVLVDLVRRTNAEKGPVGLEAGPAADLSVDMLDFLLGLGPCGSGSLIFRESR